MNYKELCDFKTINESIELKKQKGNIQKEDDKEYVCNSKNENAKDIEQLLNNISKSLHNRGRKDKFKRVWTSFLGFWSDKAGQYSVNLNKALQEVREYVKEILDGNPRFQIEFAEPKDAVKEDLDYNRIFPRYITYYKKDGANDKKDGTKSFKIWASDIQDFFENYSNKRERIINAIEKLENEKQIKKANSEEPDPISRAIKILQDCLDRGIWIAAAALLSNIKEEDMVAVINESYLPLARTYQVLDRIGKEDALFQKAIKEANIPFFSKELDAVNKHCCKKVNLESAINVLNTKDSDIDNSDLEILENLRQKLSACEAAYKLHDAKCVSASMVSLRTPTAENIYKIAEYGDNSKHDSSEKNAVVRMANKEIKKKQSKIRLGVFISIVILLLVVAIFSAFKPGIKYAIGREIVAEVDGCEYTYRKFDDTGVEIVAAKMTEGISEYAVIPEIDGHKVVAISEGAFADYTDFESVYIGKDISQIGSNAFARKDNARITIYCEAQAKPDAWAKDWANDNVVVWGWTDSQQSIEITWGNLRFAIDKEKNQAVILGLSSEAKGDEVDEIEIPSDVTYESEEYTVVRVADEAFKDAAYICKIVFEEENNAIIDIGFGAFEGCSSLTDIAIPFVGATVSGEKVSEEINTVNFGYIFGADGTAKNAEYVPATLESVTIYGGIIAANAFAGCSNLQSIVLGDSVTSIAHGAFNSNMSSLNSLMLPFVGESYDKTAFIGYIFGATDYKDNNKALPRSLQTVTVTDNCNITDYAFYGCENIVTVNIASSGETNGGIGKSAFAECIGLQTVTIENGKFIDDSAFANCTSLTKVTVPDEIESFGNDVLKGCANIEYNNSNGIKYLDGNREYYRVIIDATNVGKSVVVTNVNTRIIAQNAFNGCSIEEIIITKDVVMIGDSAFANCVNIRYLTIPDNVKKIGEGALNGCSNLLSLTLPFVGAEAGVTSTYAYQYPFGYIFGKLSYEGGVATKQYYSDSNMQSVVFGGGIKFTKSANYYIPESLCDVAITSGNILEGAFYNCNNITKITIPNTIQDIGNYAFYNCSALKMIEIPDNVTDIGNFAFYGCSSLTNINIPDSVTNIGDWAFSDCTSLTSIVIPNSVIGIGWFAFYNCTNLIKIIFENTQAWQVFIRFDFGLYTELSGSELSNSTIAATYLKDTYNCYYWQRVE